MLNSKLLEIIGVLTAKELDRLHLFLKSPYLNNGPQANDLLHLFELIQKQCLEKEQVFEQLYPGKSFSQGRIDKLMSALLKLIQHFAVVEHKQETDELEFLFQLLQFYRERGLEKRYQQTLNKLEKILSAKSQMETLSYWHFLIGEEKVAYQAYKNLRSNDLYLPEVLNRLDRFYLLSKLKYSVMLLSQNIHISLDIEDSLKILEVLTPVIEGPELKDDPPLQAYQKAYQLLRKHPVQEAHQEFLVLRKLLNESGNLLASDTRKMLHSLLRIHAVGAYNQGRQDYLQAAFELYQEHLNLGYLYYEGKLLPSTFRNIVTLGLRFGALEWVETFLWSHREKITATEYPEEVFSFNLAQLYFFQKKYHEALDQLADKYFELYYQLAARRLEIKILYEIDSPILESKIEAFKVYIFRLSQTKLPAKPKEGNNNFLDLLRQIIHPKTFQNQERIEKLKEKLCAKQVVAERDWLENVLEKLMV